MYVIASWILTFLSCAAATDGADSSVTRGHCVPGSNDREAVSGAITYARSNPPTWAVCSIEVSTRTPDCIATGSAIARLSTDRRGRIVALSTTGGTLRLLVKQADGGRKEEVAPIVASDVAMSIDGRRLAYSADLQQSIDGNDVWMARADGTSAAQITHQAYLQYWPTWTPTGEILYLSGRGEDRYDIWIVKPGSSPRQVVTRFGYCFDPVMSLRGDIAFSSNRDGNFDIWILRKGHRLPEKLVGSPDYEGEPSFSPNGEWIAYVKTDVSGSHLHIIEIASHRDELIRIDGDVRNPIWHEEGP